MILGSAMNTDFEGTQRFTQILTNAVLLSRFKV